jgi:hypothetical protein
MQRRDHYAKFVTVLDIGKQRRSLTHGSLGNGPSTVVFRFFVETDTLFTVTNSSRVFKFILGNGHPNFNSFAAKMFGDMMKLEGIESRDPPESMNDAICRAGVITMPIKFQLNTLQAMNVMEDPTSLHGIRYVKNSSEKQIDIWPRDCPEPIYFAPLTLKFSVNPIRIEHTGGLLSLGPGLGKTLLVITHTMLKRAATLAKIKAAPMERCSVGTIVVADEYLHTHWRDQIALHAPRAKVGTIYNLTRPKPNSYVDFVILTLPGLLGLSGYFNMTINRICYDEAHSLASKVKNIDALPFKVDHIWAVTATPGHAKYLAQNFDNITKVLRFPAVHPVCSKYFPDAFNSLRNMIISGGGGVVTDSLLPNLITVNTHVPLNDHDLAELASIRSMPHVTLDQFRISQISTAVRSSMAFNAPASHADNNQLRPYTQLQVIGADNLFADDDCCICMEPMQQPVALPCNHVFCYGCMSGIVQHNCALCRVPFVLGSVKQVIHAAVEGPALPPVVIKSTWTFTSTVNAVSDAVEANEQRINSGKTIIFCDTDFVLPLSTHLRTAHGVQSLWYLEEATAQVKEEAIHRFKTDPTRRVLVIDIALNAGLDLPCADNIIFTCRDAISPDSHVFRQAVGRIRRISQASTTVRANILHFEKYETIRDILTA